MVMPSNTDMNGNMHRAYIYQKKEISLAPPSGFYFSQTDRMNM